MSNRDFNFKGVPEKLQKVLGEDFLIEINKFIPKKGPDIDVFETERDVFVVVEQPGLSPNDNHINIRLEGYKLLIDGVVPYSYPVKKLIQSERFFGSFKREIVLPYSVQPKGIQATYKKGLVVITIPKKEEDESANVQIDFEED
ncbi:MAG TPA: Hsp20/alpha crystallin family protein [Bacillus bacterium]|nr:Hsp20/alpha crystallin family protein [Bacillus sp. (in: firmicutes)]